MVGGMGRSTLLGANRGDSMTPIDDRRAQRIIDQQLAMADATLVAMREAGLTVDKEKARYHSELEKVAMSPPIQGHALMSNGVCKTLFRAESPQENSDRLGRLAHHARMRRLFAWLDQHP
jgi:hypothetical protein